MILDWHPCPPTRRSFFSRMWLSTYFIKKRENYSDKVSRESKRCRVRRPHDTRTISSTQQTRKNEEKPQHTTTCLTTNNQEETKTCYPYVTMVTYRLPERTIETQQEVNKVDCGGLCKTTCSGRHDNATVVCPSRKNGPSFHLAKPKGVGPLKQRQQQGELWSQL